MIKKLLFILLICTPLLSGCWDQTELQNLGIITAAAIDHLEDGNVRISVQLFIPRTITSGETGEDPSQGSTFVRDGTGKNLAHAVSRLQMRVPRRLFWGHCKIFIFGHELAKRGIRHEIDFLARHTGPRGNSFMYVSEGEGKDLLELIPPLERYSGEALMKLTKDELGMVTTLRDIDMALMGDSKSVAVPYIKKLKPVEKEKPPHETIPFIDGSAIFYKDKMVGTLKIEDTRSLLWLKGKVKRATITAKPEEEDSEISMSPTMGKVKFKPQIKGNKWVMNVNISIEGDIIQNETHLNLLNEHVLEDIKKKFEIAVKKRVSETIDILQHEYKADVFHFGRKFHERFPKEWKQVEHNWREKFSEVDVNVNVTANIRRPGYIGPPAALPGEEVKH